MSPAFRNDHTSVLTRLLDMVGPLLRAFFLFLLAMLYVFRKWRGWKPCERELCCRVGVQLLRREQKKATNKVVTGGAVKQ